MSELRDVIASVLEEHRMKAPRVQARLVLEAIDGRPRRPKPAPSTACPRCASWDAAAVGDRSIRSQAIDAAESTGRMRAFVWWLFSELDRVGRRTG